MRILRDALPFAVPSLLLAAVLWWIGYAWVGAAFLLLAAFVCFFFRDPERIPPQVERAILSPADGKIIQVTGGPDGTRLSIFLSVFDVHVNRAPVSGRIEECEHRTGRFHLAFDERASLENEQLRLKIGDVRFALIAGLVARRIIPWKKLGDEVRAGDRIALIRFGSRVDLWLPFAAQIRVKQGDRVKAGVSILAWRGEPT